MTTTTTSTDQQAVQSETDDSGIGGDEPFCKHGNLLWSEDCDECSEEILRLDNAITSNKW